MAIELKNVSKKYRKKLVFADVDLKIEQGVFAMLRGSSGAGKSTLLNIIGGIDTPSSGEVLIDDMDVVKLRGKARAEFFQQKIGFVFQGFYLQPQLTVGENIELAGVFANMPQDERHKRVKELAEQLGIMEIVDSLPVNVSGGQAERACVAQALFMRPGILLVDEPTNNLDSRNVKKVLDMFGEVRQKLGTTVIVASHDERVEGYAQQIIDVEDGKVWVAGDNEISR